MHHSLPRRRARRRIFFFFFPTDFTVSVTQNLDKRAISSISRSPEGTGSCGQASLGSHSHTPLSPVSSCGRFENAINRTTHAPSARTQVGVTHTLTLLQTGKETARAGSLRSPSLPHLRYVSGYVGATCTVSGSLASADIRTGFYSPYFIVPKKGGGLRPILDLCVLNRALYKRPFKMLMQKRIFRCIRPQDWFAAIDLKDAYFHVSILPRHRPFLQFAFEGRAYQYKVLPFGLSLSSHVFTKVAELHESCMKVLLSPLFP